VATKMHIVEFQNIRSSPNIIRHIKQRRKLGKHGKKVMHTEFWWEIPEGKIPTRKRGKTLRWILGQY
jgi:hypothetical protein